MNFEKTSFQTKQVFNTHNCNPLNLLQLCPFAVFILLIIYTFVYCFERYFSVSLSLVTVTTV